MRATREREETDDVAFRMGGAALGMLSGSLLGFMIAAVAFDRFTGDSCFAVLVFGGAAVGAVLGYIRALAGFRLAEGAAHLVVGFISGVAERIIQPLPDASSWLKCIHGAGLVLGFAVAVRLFR